MKTITAAELDPWLRDETRPRPLLLDVREPWEFQICRIEGSELIPIRALAVRFEELDRERPIVCICHHGNRSGYATMLLMQHGFTDVYNLAGGVDAWARQVDPAMPVY